MTRRTPGLALLLLCAACAAQTTMTVQELYGSAREAAADGRHDAALAALEQAAARGFRGLQQLQSEPAFETLHDDARFQAIGATVRRNLFPCESSARHREFDFWLGTWDVYMRNDVKAGSNRITRLENGCVLEEVWTSVSGGTGRSLNYYDPHKDKWVQHWVSADGLIVDIEGGLQEGSMVMSGRSFYTASGKAAEFRGTWTLLEDGRVRQFFEESYDDGATWTPWFEGFYVRTGKPAD